MTEEIKDMSVYVKRMRKSLLDKLFFMDKTYAPVTAVIDFGCANGVLIHAMKEFFPEYKYFGYDINPEMIAQAKELVSEAEFFSDWDIMMDAIDKQGIKTDDCLINISSVIHEVYSYGKDIDIKNFYDRIFNSNFHYIAIRDMMPQSSYQTINKDDLEKLKKSFPKQIKDFENIWGCIHCQRDLMHFLLKYKYIENWDREVRENYFPITVEEFLSVVYSHPYQVVYEELVTPPYIAQSIWHDTKIILTQTTHCKLLLERY